MSIKFKCFKKTQHWQGLFVFLFFFPLPHLLKGTLNNILSSKPYTFHALQCRNIKHRKWLGPTMSKIVWLPWKVESCSNVKHWGTRIGLDIIPGVPSIWVSLMQMTPYTKYSPWFDFQHLHPCSFQADIALLCQTSQKLNLLTIQASSKAMHWTSKAVLNLQI